VFERRFETPPGRQARVDFAQFRTVFADEPGVAALGVDEGSEVAPSVFEASPLGHAHSVFDLGEGCSMGLMSGL